MEINKEHVRKAIDGDRLELIHAFAWGATQQGHSYWENQYIGKTPIDIDTLREMIGEGTTITAGNTYIDCKGAEWECIFVRNGVAWMTNGKGTAYTWNAKTGESRCLAIDKGYNIAFPKRRKGSVEYVNGEPQFDTWQEDE